MRKFDVVIIGGGIVGTSIARELSRYRLEVALLEKEEELAFGVSKSNSGIIHPGTQNPPGSLKGRLCVLGNKLTREVSRELGVDFKEVGEIIVAFNGDDMKELERIKKEAEEIGVPGLRMVDRKWLKENEPNLSENVIAALYAPTAGIISPYRLVYDLSENAGKNGVRIFTSAKVVSIRTGQAVCSSRGRFGVETSAGDVFEGDYVINAAGLFADKVSSMVGVTDFNIIPRKGEEFLLDKKKEHMAEHLIFPLPTKTSKGVLIIKTSDGNPMIGPTAYEIEDKTDLATTEWGLAHVLENVKRMMPSISENDIIAYFSGLRPTAGGDFMIRHEDKVPGFINVAGIQSPGLTAAPAIARMVAGILKANGLKLRKKLFFRRTRKRTAHLFAGPVSLAEKLVKKDPAYGDIVCRCEMVSAKEIRDAVKRGARTMDGVKFRTRAQAGRCHGSFCTTRIMKILAEERKIPPTAVTKRGKGSEIVKMDRAND
jgi:glycerol-3-phosphate dehydrogenase